MRCFVDEEEEESQKEAADADDSSDSDDSDEVRPVACLLVCSNAHERREGEGFDVILDVGTPQEEAEEASLGF